MTLIDYYSKWTEIAFTTDVTSATVVKFLSAAFSCEGNPLQLKTDNGSQFVSAKFETFLADRDIKNYRRSVYYPQANGEIECFKRVFTYYFQTTSIKGKEWKASVTYKCKQLCFYIYKEQLNMLWQNIHLLLHGWQTKTKLHVSGRPCVAPPKASTESETNNLTVPK